jgi:hypothetical protein
LSSFVTTASGQIVGFRGCIALTGGYDRPARGNCESRRLKAANRLCGCDSWVARATAQPTDLDPEIGQTSLEWAKQNLLEQYRGDEDSGQVFGFEVTVAPDAPVYDRLAGFFGRTV